ncbi:hypothetical protein LZK73_18615 [Neorhizobium galegae]|nr:hypothetical protein LZK73_18615 [Neorhizobium galegae]
MFKTISTNNEVRDFNSYAEAHRFVMAEGDKSRLWEIKAASLSVLAAARAAKEAFHDSTRNLLAA